MKPATEHPPITLSSYTVKNMLAGVISSTITPIDPHPHNLSQLFTSLAAYTVPAGADAALLHQFEAANAFYLNYGDQHIAVHNAAEAYLVLAEVIDVQIIGAQPVEMF